jgi:hypothetical protein
MRPAGRVAANPKPENSVLVDIHMGRTENYAIVQGLKRSCQHQPQARMIGRRTGL